MRIATTFLLPLLSLTILPAAPARGGWMAFGEPQTAAAGLTWLNRAADTRTVSATLRMDPGLAVPAVRAAAVATGSPRFRIDASGEFIVEVFVQLTARADADMELRAGGKVLDGRLRAAPLRMYPGSKQQRTWPLSGVVRGGEEFELTSTYGEFLLVAARWTPREEFERAVAPRLAARLKQMAADPYFEGLRSGRAPRLRELGDLEIGRASCRERV